MKSIKITFSLYVIILIFVSNFVISDTSISLQEDDREFVYTSPSYFYEFSYLTDIRDNTRADFRIMNAVSASLFRPDSSNNGELTEWFADTLSITPDGKNYTVTIKQGMLFEDGTPFTADDVVFTYEILLDPIFNITSLKLLIDDFSINSVVKVDDLTVRIEFNQIHAFNIRALSIPILNQIYFSSKWDICKANDVYMADDCSWNDPSGADITGGGPYKVDTIDLQNKIVTLIKNNNYFSSDSVYFDKIIFKQILNGQILTETTSGNIDLIDHKYLIPLDNSYDTTKFTSKTSNTSETIEMALNNIHPMYGTGEGLPLGTTATTEDRIMGAKSVRNAMSHVLNRSYIISEIFDNLAIPLSTPIPPTTTGLDNTISPDPFNIEIARSLMNSAGFDYSTLIYNQTSDTYNTFFFNVTLLRYIDCAMRNYWHNIFEEDLPKIGIGVTEIVSQGWDEIIPRTFGWQDASLVPLWDDGGYDIFFIAYGWPLDYNPQYLFDTNGLCDTGTCDNWYNFANQEITGLVADYQVAIDTATRINLLQQIQSFLAEWKPVIPIASRQHHWLYNSSIVGLDFQLLSQNLQQWDLVSVEVDDPETPSSPSQILSSSAVETYGFTSLATLLSIIVLLPIVKKNSNK